MLLKKSYSADGYWNYLIAHFLFISDISDIV